MTLFKDIMNAVFSREDEDAIPVMDGVLAPNSSVDLADTVGEHLVGAEDFYFVDGDEIVVAAGNEIVQFSISTPDKRTIVASFPDRLSAILPLPDGRIIAGVSGQGLFVTDGGKTSLLNAESTCPTALALTASGQVLVANGSTEHNASDWAFDLMRHGASGSVSLLDPNSGNLRVLHKGLRWPAGVAESADGDIIFTESWGHSLSTLGKDARKPKSLLRNLIGYPARISKCQDGGYFLAIFALRTQLVELVLRENDFRNEMIDTIDPALWIIPAWSTDGDYREPLQGGGIKKLGIQKPWAPPRAYGLVVRFDADWEMKVSYHSRVGGRWHGISRAQEYDGNTYILSKGRGQLLKLRKGAQA